MDGGWARFVITGTAWILDCNSFLLEILFNVKISIALFLFLLFRYQQSDTKSPLTTTVVYSILIYQILFLLSSS
jgi:hypothetical protein